MNKNIFIFSFIFAVFLSSIYGEVERRAAIDIGSGGTKVAIADVDMETNQILAILLDTSFSVPYQASLDQSQDGTFDSATRNLGIQTFQEIKHITELYQVKKTVAIATSAFRKANNVKAYVSEVEKSTGIRIQIIPQREEGELAFYSALATGTLDPKEAVVWDIGTGSLQITTLNTEDGLTVYMGEQMGSVAFKNYIISSVKDEDVEETASPNPINSEEVKLADSYARSFARKAYPIIKEKIQSNGSVIGIGRLFYHSIRPLAAEDGIITRSGLRKYIESSLNKTDEELNNPYAHVDVTNCILTLAIMKALHIHEIVPIETTTTRGLLISKDYWE